MANLGGLEIATPQFGGGTASSPTKLLGKGANTVFDLLSPGKSRMAKSGLFPGGENGFSKAEPNIGFASANGSGAASASEDDWRVRVSLPPKASVLYQDPTIGVNAIMYPLLETNGVIWPYTPSITVTHSAHYSTAQLTHSNYPAHFYNNSEVADISITGDFTVQSVEDGQYLMAVIYFFRSATKMFFGQGANAGNPPPLVFLDGYGSHYFPHVPCVVTSFTHTMPDSVDYIEVPITSSTLDTSPIEPNSTMQLSAAEQKFVPSLLRSETQATTASTKATMASAAAASAANRTKDIVSRSRVPTISAVTVILRPVYSRKNLHENFDLGKFATGSLLGDPDKGLGGFI